MVNMKRSRKDSTMLGECCSSEQPEYPYGLSISLETESLAQLGMNELPEVGASMTLVARVVVVSVSKSEYQDQKNRDVSLQITDMDITPEGGKTTGQSLYPNSNMA